MWSWWRDMEIKQWKDVLHIVSGKNQKAVENPNGKYPIYGSGGLMGYADDYLCEAGTTIVGRKGTINRPIFVPEPFWNIDTAFGVVPDKELDPKYLYYFCVHFNFMPLDKSTGRPSLAKSDLLKIEMPVPPLPEQERIVARIEELFSQLDAGVETLKKTKAQLAVYRQAVVEDAIATAKHRGATVLPFGTFVLQYQNGISKRSGEGIQTPVLRLADIENQRISNDDGLRLIGLSKIERDRFVLKRGDLLIVRVNGSEKNVGRAIVVDKDDSYAACDHFIRCLVDFSHIIPEYAQLLLDSFSARKHIKENMVSSAGQNTVSQTTMSSIMVYVPDISLQEKIMVSVNERFSMCDSIEQTVDTALQQAEAMRQSILKDAFEGRL